MSNKLDKILEIPKASAAGQSVDENVKKHLLSPLKRFH
jgi:hypothetical protein